MGGLGSAPRGLFGQAAQAAETDATGSNAGDSVTVAASAPTVGGTTAGAGTGGSFTLTPDDRARRGR